MRLNQGVSVQVQYQYKKLFMIKWIKSILKRRKEKKSQIKAIRKSLYDDNKNWAIGLKLGRFSQK